MSKSFLGRPWWQAVLAAAFQAVPLSGCGGAAHTVAAAPTPAPAHPTPTAGSAEARATGASVATGNAKDPSAGAAAEPPASSESAEPARAVPSACVADSALCAAPTKFVEQVCHGKYPDLALVMLAKGTPWRRGYVKVEKLEPVNMYDGERNEDWLTFGEEVLILRTRGPGASSGIQISGPTDVDILRWDGTCATIRQEMLAPYPTNTSVPTPRIAWKYLDAPIQAALLTNPVVAHYSEKEAPACHGSTMKHPDAACDKANRKLTDAVTVALRGGLALPAPTKLPAW
jgi:hypothetical protein